MQQVVYVPVITLLLLSFVYRYQPRNVTKGITNKQQLLTSTSCNFCAFIFTAIKI